MKKVIMILLKKIGRSILVCLFLAVVNILLQRYAEKILSPVTLGQMLISALVLGILYGLFLFMIGKINFERIARKLSYCIIFGILGYGVGVGTFFFLYMRFMTNYRTVVSGYGALRTAAIMLLGGLVGGIATYYLAKIEEKRKKQAVPEGFFESGT